jgi:pimeloyl-ACP methyl ester carboxylesterase
VRDYWTVEEAAIERGDLDAAADANVRFWIGPAGAAVRARVHAMQLRALELQVPVGEDDPEVPLVADLNARLGEIAAPALVVAGALDHRDIHAIAARLVAALPHATRADIAAAAHLPSLERPAAFDAAVAPFLAVSGARA